MKKLIFDFLDKSYGFKLNLVSYLFTLKYHFINENNELVLGYESLGEDGTVVVIKKIKDSVVSFFSISPEESETLILQWFIKTYGDENNNTIKKIFNNYKSKDDVRYIMT